VCGVCVYGEESGNMNIRFWNPELGVVRKGWQETKR
jgi:hypothetical protein